MDDVNVTRIEDTAEQTQLAERSVGALSWANALTITTDAELAEADAFQCHNEEFLKRIEGFFRPKIKRWDEGHKAELASYYGVANPLKEAKRIAKGKMGFYQQEQARQRALEQHRREEAARKEEDDRRLREAEALEAQGQLEEADLVVGQPEVAPVVAAVPPPPKTKTRLATRWKHEIVTPNLVPRPLCVPSDALIQAQLRRTNDPKIPGVRAWRERS